MAESKFKPLLSYATLSFAGHISISPVKRINGPGPAVHGGQHFKDSGVKVPTSYRTLICLSVDLWPGTISPLHQVRSLHLPFFSIFIFILRNFILKKYKRSKPNKINICIATLGKFSFFDPLFITYYLFLTESSLIEAITNFLFLS